MNQPRRHHYVSQFYLAGFTNNGKKDGIFYVTDLQRKKQFLCKPSNIANAHDFYRVDIPKVDPFIVERELAKIEAMAAKALKEILKNKRLDDENLDMILHFVALQLTKTPSMRKKLSEPVVTVVKHIMDMMLDKPERYYGTIEDAKKDGVDIGETVSYEEMKAVNDRNGFKVSTTQNWDVEISLKMAEEALALLRGRKWILLEPESRTDLFICSDSPVMIGPLKESGIVNSGGLGTLDTFVYMPLSSNMALQGVFEEPNILAEPAQVQGLRYIDSKQVASYNTFTLMNAKEQIYSRDKTFKTIDQVGKLVEIEIDKLCKK